LRRENSTVSVIIVNYNGKHFLKDCLESIQLSEASDAEVIIVDNASSDGSGEYLRREFPSVKVMELDRNYGFAEANNRGAEAASGKFLVFLNNDTVVTRGWLMALLEAMSTEPVVGAAGSKLLLYHLPGKVNSAGANIVFNGGGYDIGFTDDDSPKYNVPGLRGAVCAASMMVRRSEFLSLGGFDPLYFMYFEDVDLCWRYWLWGYKVMFTPQSVVYHRFGGTTGSDRHTPLRVFYGTRNALFNILKNYELRSVIPPLIFSFLYHGVKFLGLVVTLRFKSALALLRAYGSLVRHLPEVLRKREEVQAGRKVSDRFLTENGLIISLAAAVKEWLRLKRA
jgi:GT2 family glycosyltransferase